MKKYETQKSAAFRRQMKVGREISKQLEKAIGSRHTQQQVADAMGLSQEGVRRIEYRALFKIAQRMKGYAV
jgi:hypothetical protein